MGYPSSNHIKEFVRGQTVRQLTTDKNGCAWLELASGEKLRMFPTTELGKPVIIATPFCADGQVKTSTQIMANAKPASEVAGSATISVFATMPDGERRHERYPSRCAAARGIREARAKGGYDINVFDPWLPKSPNDSGEPQTTCDSRKP